MAEQCLRQKLQLKPGTEVLVLNAPEEVKAFLEKENLNIVTNQSEAARYKAVQLVVRSKAELIAWAPKTVAALLPESILWIAYPKKAAGFATDLTRDEGWALMQELGFVAVRQISLDVTWSSVRFRQQHEQKKPSAFGLDLPGIDRIAKTATLPPDMQAALQEAGLLEHFEKLAFTHRKEYVVAVLQAKRPETRANRILKTVQALAASIAEK